MTKRTTLRQASQLIRTAHRPLLICHVAPDGDAVGSMTGLAFALRQLDQSPIAACADPIPSRYDYIPGARTIALEVAASFDLVVTLDCSDLRRLGRLSDLPHLHEHPLLNIDHHITNEGFGDVDLVDPEASSTAEVLLYLLDELGIELDDEPATSLLAGIVTDTRGFRTNNVTPRVLEAALRLMEAGASLPHISQHGLDQRPMVIMRLWGQALSDFGYSEGIIWTSVPLEMRREIGYQGNGDAGLASFLISANEADVSAVFVEQEDGSVDVGMRANPGFDVARLAVRFGGGGHALAAGFSAAGPLERAEQRILEALRAELASQRTHGG